jgi:hypothetical protein
VRPTFYLLGSSVRNGLGRQLHRFGLKNCEVESDLPERFIFGRMVPGFFESHPDGFSARFASSYIDTVVSGDGVKLRFEVKIERSDPYYHVCHCSNMNWNPGLLNQLTATKSDLESKRVAQGNNQTARDISFGVTISTRKVKAPIKRKSECLNESINRRVRPSPIFILDRALSYEPVA